MINCIAHAAQVYSVETQVIQREINKNKIEHQGLGIMGIPTSWLPILRKAGFSESEINNNKCINIAAGTWILDYLHKNKLPPVKFHLSIKDKRYAEYISHSYHIPYSRLKLTIEKNKASPKGIGIIGIPSLWLPILKEAGFPINKINSDYWNIAAGAWILLKLKKADHNIYEEHYSLNYSVDLFKRYQPIFIAAGNKYHIDPALLEGIAVRESGFNPKAISDKGAEGMMQFIPSTAALYGVRNPFNAAQSIMGAARYIKHLMTEFHGKKTLVIAAYNAGGEAVKNYGYKIPPYPETQKYVPNVLSSYYKFRTINTRFKH
jgi:hypothetical protein